MIDKYFLVVLCIYVIMQSYKVVYVFSVYKKMEDAMSKHKEADVMVNFASLRSAYESSVETLNFPQVTFINSVLG